MLNYSSMLKEITKEDNSKNRKFKIHRVKKTKIKLQIYSLGQPWVLQLMQHFSSQSHRHILPTAEDMNLFPAVTNLVKRERKTT